MSGRIVAVLFTLASFITMGSCAKVLLISVPLFSHCAEVSGVGHALLDRNHSVFILIGSSFNHKNCFDKGRAGIRRIEPIYMRDSPDIKGAQDIIGELSGKGAKDGLFTLIKQHSLFQNMTSSICQNLFYDREVIKNLESAKFDLAIVDMFSFSYCLFLLPSKLGIPYIGHSSHIDPFVTASPFLPSIVPNHRLSYSDSMTFLQRLANCFCYFFFSSVMLFLQPMHIVNHIEPSLSRHDLINLPSKSELFLFNHDFILSYPIPVMPNHVLIGGISTGPAKPLPSSLDKLYKKSTKDFILVTFGATVGDIEDSVDNILIHVFHKLNVNVIWKHNNERDDRNIKFLQWVPQNDLLGNPKTKVFVSHCGNNGVAEALYHGVPIVCTPMFADQFYNGVRVQKWGAGKMLPLMTSSEEEFYEAIHSVLTDPSYRMNMKVASEMYHNQPMKARGRATFWIEYVLKFGGGHLRSQASHLSAFVFMGYDLLCFVLVVISCTVLFFLKLFLFVLRCFRSDRKIKLKHS